VWEFSCEDDLEHVHLLKSLVSTLENLREAKLRDSFQKIDAGVSTVKIRDVSKLELEKIRNYLIPALNQFAMIKHIKGQDGQDEDEQRFGGASSQFYEQDNDEAPINLRPYRN
jgi:hypothetical protein